MTFHVLFNSYFVVENRCKIVIFKIYDINKVSKTLVLKELLKGLIFKVCQTFRYKRLKKNKIEYSRIVRINIQNKSWNFWIQKNCK